MMQTLKVKLETTPEQYQALLKTMHQFNAACNFVAEKAFELHTANKIELQKVVYHLIREQFGISAQMAVRAISKAAEAYKRAKSIKPEFEPNGAVIYDQRIMSWKGLDRVSLLTLEGRVRVPVLICDYHAPRLDRIRGQADLILRKGSFYLCVVVDVPESKKIQPVNALGVDLGIKNIAVDSSGEEFSGEKIEKVRTKTDNLKADLQRCGTKNAKRHLKKLSGKEARFHRDTNHCISKKLVAKAKDTSSLIVLEDIPARAGRVPDRHLGHLRGIRERSTVKKAQRRKQHNWSFSQSNRPTRDDFHCVCCGFSGPADTIAATNIAARVSVNIPIVARFLRESQLQAPP